MNFENRSGGPDAIFRMTIVFVLAVGLALSMFWYFGFPLPFLSRPGKPSMNSCVNCLRQIDGAKEQWSLEHQKTNGIRVTVSDLTNYFKGGVLPVCPSGGRYVLGRVGEVPRCSLESSGHTL